MAFTTVHLNPAAKRFGVKFNQQYLWITTVVAAATLVPTKIEVDGGTLLEGHMNAVNGLTVTDAYADTPDLVSEVTGRVPDGATLADSSLSMYLSEDEDDAYDFFTRGQTGVLYFLPYGLAGAKPAEAYDVVVGSVVTGKAIGGTAALVNVGISPRAFKKIVLPADV